MTYLERKFGFGSRRYPGEVACVLSTLIQRGPLSLTELATFTGSGVPDLSRLAGALAARRLIISDGDAQETRLSATRRLRINPDGAFSVGVIVDGDMLRIAVIDLERRIRKTASCFIGDKHLVDVVEIIQTELRGTLNGATYGTIEGICLSFTESASMTSRPQTLGDGDLTAANLRRDLSLTYRVPVFVEAEVAVAAIGELQCGRAKSAESFVYILLDRDVSCGLVDNGKYVRSGKLGPLPLMDAANPGHSCHGETLGDMLKTMVSGQHPIAPFEAKQLAAFLFVPLLTLANLVRPEMIYINSGSVAMTERLCIELDQVADVFNSTKGTIPTFACASARDISAAVGAATIPFAFGLLRPHLLASRD